MKNILKIQIKAFLVIALLFGLPGFVLPSNSAQKTKPSTLVLEASQRPFESLSMKVLPASPLGFLQTPFQVQRTEGMSMLQQSGDYEVQASLANNSYQLGNIRSVSLGAVLKEYSVSKNLRVSPLKVAFKNLTNPESVSFFGSFSFMPGATSQEKGLMQFPSLIIRFKMSSIPSATLGTTAGQGISGDVSTAVGIERFVFRC